MSAASPRPVRERRRTATVAFRPAVAGDLAACGEIWRDALNDYMGRLNLPLIPPEVAAIARLHAHVLATDPERFQVAVRRDGPGRTERIIGFGAAARRGGVWFLSMLFVRPGEQGGGLGRALLARMLPADDAILATATDSAQPIANALYATYGMVPRMPLLNLVGRPADASDVEQLPAGVTAIPFEAAASNSPSGDGHRDLVAAVTALDTEVLGFAHPLDHRFIRDEGRLGFLYRGGDGSIAGYGYTSEAGRVGPVAVRDEAMLPGVLGHLLTVVAPRGASALWVPGLADRAVVGLLRSGLRLEGFPVLLCWTRPFADFRRYIPISPGLL